MKVLLVATASIVAFLAAFWLARVVPAAMGAIAVFQKSISALRDDSLTDDDRERIMRQGSVTLLVAFASIAVRSTAALAAALVPILLADWSGLAPRSDVFSFLARVDVIVVATVLIGVGYFAFARLWRR